MSLRLAGDGSLPGDGLVTGFRERKIGHFGRVFACWADRTSGNEEGMFGQHGGRCWIAEHAGVGLIFGSTFGVRAIDRAHPGVAPFGPGVSSDTRESPRVAKFWQAAFEIERPHFWCAQINGRRNFSGGGRVDINRVASVSVAVANEAFDDAIGLMVNYPPDGGFIDPIARGFGGFCHGKGHDQGKTLTAGRGLGQLAPSYGDLDFPCRGASEDLLAGNLPSPLLDSVGEKAFRLNCGIVQAFLITLGQIYAVGNE